jgi:hypothetical protein
LASSPTLRQRRYVGLPSKQINNRNAVVANVSWSCERNGRNRDAVGNVLGGDPRCPIDPATAFRGDVRADVAENHSGITTPDRTDVIKQTLKQAVNIFATDFRAVNAGMAH